MEPRAEKMMAREIDHTSTISPSTELMASDSASSLLHPGDAALVLRLHAGFAAAAVAALATFLSTDAAVSLLVVGWHAAAAGCLRRPPSGPSARRHRDGARPAASRRLLLGAYRFSAVSSLSMVLPDWFLCETMGTLVFPDRGGVPRLGGAVPWYMAGMWTIPFFLIIAASLAFVRPGGHRGGDLGGAALATSAVVALTLTGGAEFILYHLDLWRCTDRVRVRVLGHVAAYVLPAEALIGPVLLRSFASAVDLSGADDCAEGARASARGSGRDGGLLRMALAGGTVMIIYTGSLAISHLFIEDIYNRSLS